MSDYDLLIGVKVQYSADIAQAPVITLKAPQKKKLRAIYQQTLKDQKIDLNGKDVDKVVKAAADAENTFQIDLPKITLKVDAAGKGISANLNTHFDVAVSLSKKGLPEFTVISTELTPDTGNKIINALCSSVLNSVLQTKIQDILSEITIPALSFGGVDFSVPLVNISNQCFYLASTIVGGEPPRVPKEGFYAQDQGLSLKFSDDMLQAMVGPALKDMTVWQGKGSEGDSCMKAYYNVAMIIQHPAVKVRKNNLKLSCGIFGKVKAGVHVLWVPISLGYKAFAKPDPTIKSKLLFKGSDLMLKLSAVDSFTVLVQPTGSIPGKVLSWMTQFIVQSIIAAASPAIPLFINGKKIKLFSIPVRTQTIGGSKLTITPDKLKVGIYDKRISITGNLNLS